MSDVCSSDLPGAEAAGAAPALIGRRALRQGGEPIAKMARAIAPVDEGNLRESIDVSTRLARSQAGDKGALAPVDMRSEERRGGKECVRPCRSRWSPEQ